MGRAADKIECLMDRNVNVCFRFNAEKGCKEQALSRHPTIRVGRSVSVTTRKDDQETG